MPKHKRGQGEGSIRQRPDGKWEARYTLGSKPNGKPDRRSVYGETHKEVQQKLNDILNAQDKGIFVAPSKLTVAQWMDIWMEEYKMPSVRPATIDSYTRNIGNHIKPTIGRTALSKLRPEQIQKLLNDMIADGGRSDGKEGGTSAATAIKVKNILNGAMKQALRNGLIARNPVDAVTPPRHESKDIRYLSPDEQNSFEAVLNSDRLGLVYNMALRTGMRLGEVIGLSWSNVDMDKGVIYVKRSLGRVRNKKAKTSRLMLEPVKSSTSDRMIPIMDSLMPMLKAHKVAQNKEKLLIGRAWEQKDMVFTTKLGRFLEPRNIQRKLEALVKRAGIEHVNFHALRHTFATRMLEAGVNAKVLQEILGHKDIKLTLGTYAHVMDETKVSEMAKLEAHLHAIKSR